MCRNVICRARPAVRNLDFASLHLGRGLRPIGLYGNPLPEASFLPRVPANPGTAHCQDGKNALHTYVQRANVSRYHLFLRKPLMLCLKRIFTHGKIDKQLRIFPSVTGSPVITYPSFDFSDPVQKLPSISSIPDDLSAGGSSSLAASENVLLFLITFSYIPAILAETHYFVKPK